MATHWVAILGVGWAGLSVVSAVGAEPPAPSETKASPDDVVAKVDGKEITRADLDIVIRGGRKPAPGTAPPSPATQAHALNQLIDRRLIEAHLSKKGYTLTEPELDAQLETIKRDIIGKGKTWEWFLGERGVNDEIARRELRWEKSWNRYLVRNFNQEKVQSYFNSHRRQFDGSELRVSHILLRPAHSGDASSLAALMRQAESIRAKIAGGELTFAQAVEKYSAGPSRREGGDLGFIPRRGRMSEEFSKAAFALEKDQLSKPVVTNFGVHLIRWTEEKPGAKKWDDVADEIKTAIAMEEFENLAVNLRPNAKIEFTAPFPHFKPGTQELVNP